MSNKDVYVAIGDLIAHGDFFQTILIVSRKNYALKGLLGLASLPVDLYARIFFIASVKTGLFE